MSTINRRSILKLGASVLAAGLGGCLSDGDADLTNSKTDSPIPSETPTPRPECQGSPTDYAWETSGSWHVDMTVTNVDESMYTVTVVVNHHGSEPCHHVETTPCQAPEKYVTAFERTFDLDSNESETFSEITLELWENWIDEYTIQVRIENEEGTPRDRITGFEMGAKEPVGTDKYEHADFNVCDGSARKLRGCCQTGRLR